MEAKIITKFGFDFTVPGPYQSYERFIRLLGYHDNFMVREMGSQILMFQLNDIQFLAFRPSMVAACAAIIAFNIFHRDERQYRQKNATQGAHEDSGTFFKTTSAGLLQMNTDIWSPDIASVTGYPVDSLRPLLFRLGTFISENLQPDRLAGFDLSCILKDSTI